MATLMLEYTNTIFPSRSSRWFSSILYILNLKKVEKWLKGLLPALVSVNVVIRNLQGGFQHARHKFEIR